MDAVARHIFIQCSLVFSAVVLLMKGQIIRRQRVVFSADTNRCTCFHLLLIVIQKPEYGMPRLDHCNHSLPSCSITALIPSSLLKNCCLSFSQTRSQERICGT